MAEMTKLGVRHLKIMRRGGKKRIKHQRLKKWLKWGTNHRLDRTDVRRAPVKIYFKDYYGVYYSFQCSDLPRMPQTVTWRNRSQSPHP